MKKCLFFLCLFILCRLSNGQKKIVWHEPKFVEGVCVEDTANIFHRLPAEMKGKVRQPVWDLSENTAGEFIHFKTSSSTIKVQYVLANTNFSMPHMPSTGVSGVDLYAIDIKGNWNWAPGIYHFGDTCTYVFDNLFLTKSGTSVSDFYLYLPLYNSVKWLSIGVDEKAEFSFAKKKTEKTIVAYGTSILQGGVASRPGLAWTNILERSMNRVVINLGFSGNGKFEQPLFDLMGKLNAEMFILDCMPNLTRGLSYEEIKNRVNYGVHELREKNKGVPILFVENADGFSHFYMDSARLNLFHRSSKVIAKIFDELQTSGIKNIYLLTDEEIGFDINSTTDGIHPNDIGMMKYANSFEKKINEILANQGRKKNHFNKL